MKRIFCADDDPGLQEVYSIIFSRAGYDITMFSSGEDLLQNESDPPDLFLLDKQFSGLSGTETCQALKSHPATEKIPVIIISASADLEQQSSMAGADDCIKKPFTLKSLMAVISKYLG